MRHKKICDCCSLTKDLSDFLNNPNAPVNNLVKQINKHFLKRKYQQESICTLDYWYNLT